jgi:hypothetical protein
VNLEINQSKIKNLSNKNVSYNDSDRYLDDASERKSSVSSQIEDSISDDIIDDVSVAVTVPRPPILVILK